MIGLSVTSKIDEQQIEMLLIRFDLLKPDRRTATSTMYENNPLITGRVQIGFVEKKWLSHVSVRITLFVKGNG
ncbi:hypothetical protein THZG08_90051 [Vibrio owensii]|nr:hypothetical protein THZG08_90051 [Vibrio owensii]CAH1593765.1 hypothetical protein THOA03_90051 [Vibrio owensii]